MRNLPFAVPETLFPYTAASPPTAPLKRPSLGTPLVFFCYQAPLLAHSSTHCRTSPGEGTSRMAAANGAEARVL